MKQIYFNIQVGHRNVWVYRGSVDTAVNGYFITHAISLEAGAESGCSGECCEFGSPGSLPCECQVADTPDFIKDIEVGPLAIAAGVGAIRNEENLFSDSLLSDSDTVCADPDHSPCYDWACMCALVGRKSKKAIQPVVDTCSIALGLNGLFDDGGYGAFYSCMFDYCALKRKGAIDGLASYIEAELETQASARGCCEDLCRDP